jgi:hypothetical protein
MVEMAKITNANTRTCLIVYITKDGTKRDDTMESLKRLVPIPILYVSEADAEERISELQTCMDAYKAIQDGYKCDRETQRAILEHLYIEDFSEPCLHIIIFFDDFANSPLVKNPKSYFNNFIATLRHRGFSVFICIQYWKSIPTQLKSNITTIYIFPCYSREVFGYILRQIPIEMSLSEAYSIYQKLGKNQKMIVDCINGNIKLS